MPRTPVPAAGEAMPAANLNRRAILTGTAATAAALAASTLPAPAETSPILAAFAEWQRLNALADQFYWQNDCEFDEFCDGLRTLELQIVAIPARTGAEFAAKVLAQTNMGVFMLTPGDEDEGYGPIIEEALALIARAS